MSGLARAFEAAVDRALDQVRGTDPATLPDARAVGRDRVPSTVLGLLVHAAEHTQRHAGQLLVTASVVSTPPNVAGAGWELAGGRSPAARESVLGGTGGYA